MAVEHIRVGHRVNIMAGVDIGSTSVKVAIVAVENGVLRELAVRSAPTPTDMGTLLAEVFRLLREVVAHSPHPPAAIGITSMAETGVPLDAHGVALTGILRWDRARDSTEADSLIADFGAESLFAATGVPPGPKAPLCTWLWLGQSHPGVFRAMARWAGIADVVAMALTDRLVTDHTLAGRTMAYRLPPAGEPLPEGFDDELLSLVGLRQQHLPDVVRPGEAAGSVTQAASAATGIQAGVPVFVAGHDHAVGAWAAGMRQPGDAADSVGTTEGVVSIASHALNRSRVAPSGMSIVRTVTGEHEALLGGSPAAGSLVQWWAENELSATTLASMLDSLSLAAAERSGAIVLPYPRGRQCPVPDEHATLRVLADDDATPLERTRALFEALAFQARWIYESQRQLSREYTRGRPVHLIGSAVTANTFWAAVKATAMPVQLHLAAVQEPVAAGAALLAGVRAGVLAEAPPLPAHAVAPLPLDLESSYAAFLAAATAVAHHKGEQ